MVPVAILQILFRATIGYTLLEKTLKPGNPDFNKNNSFANPVYAFESPSGSIPAWKGTLSIAVLAACIVGFILTGISPFKNYLNIANMALLGAAILLASGGGKIIADFVLNLFGGEAASLIVLTIAITLLSSVLTLFMQNVSVAARDPDPDLHLHGSEFRNQPDSLSDRHCNRRQPGRRTPIGTAVNMQILPVGYTFKDFLKIGGPLFLLMAAGVAIISSLLYF